MFTNILKHPVNGSSTPNQLQTLQTRHGASTMGSAQSAQTPSLNCLSAFPIFVGVWPLSMAS